MREPWHFLSIVVCTQIAVAVVIGITYLVGLMLIP